MVARLPLRCLRRLRRGRAPQGGLQPLAGDGAAAATAAEWLHEFSFPAGLAEIPTARRRVATLAEACGLSGPELFDLLLAVGEALANAVKHGSPHREADRVSVRVGLQDGGVAVEVRDQGPGFGASRLGHPEVLESCGRGIPFMRALVDELRFDCRPGGTSVVLRKRIH
jgi:anti-sigma regulatory factor (Ser/Thr protein kinase)